MFSSKISYHSFVSCHVLIINQQFKFCINLLNLHAFRFLLMEKAAIVEWLFVAYMKNIQNWRKTRMRMYFWAKFSNWWVLQMRISMQNSFSTLTILNDVESCNWSRFSLLSILTCRLRCTKPMLKICARYFLINSHYFTVYYWERWWISLNTNLIISSPNFPNLGFVCISLYYFPGMEGVNTCTGDGRRRTG